jgi:DNA repair photolyase
MEEAHKFRPASRNYPKVTWVINQSNSLREIAASAHNSDSIAACGAQILTADNVKTYNSEQKANVVVPSLFPIFPAAKEAELVGIARLAAEGESLREGHNVEYFTLPARSLLNRCNSSRNLPFVWTINPYRGCEFGCRYCYARYTHEFMEMRDGMEFEQKIYVKQQAAELLRRDLRRVKLGESIALGTATDPYQPAERRYEVTRGILEEFVRHRGFELGIVTKGNLIVRDLDLLREVSRNNALSVHISITTLNAELARILEPRAPRPDLRLDAVRRLSEAGIVVGVSCSPVLPSITDSPANLEAVVQAAAAAGARHIFAGPLFLKPCSAAVFLPFLEQHFPHLVENYRRRYQDRSFLPASYGKRIAQLTASFREKYGIKRADPRRKEFTNKWPAVAAGEQLDLF